MKIWRHILLLLIALMALPAFTVAEETPAAAEETAAPIQETPSPSEKTREPAQGAIPCEYSVPEDVQTYVSHLYDGDPFTTVTLRQNERIIMTVPDGARILQLGFYEANKIFSLYIFDSEGKVIDSSRTASAIGYLHVAVDERAATAVLICESWSLAVTDWYAVADESVLPFPDEDDKADVLVVLNAPGDELEKLGGILPTLCGEHGLSAKVIYMSAADGYRSFQCMQVLQEMGIRKAPYFGKGRELNSKSDKVALAVLGMTQEQLMQFFATEMRTCRPQIVLTLDPHEEDAYLEGFIARQVLESVSYAEDADYYRQYEPFTPNKVYTVTTDGGTVFSGNTPLYAYNGFSAASVAGELYKSYRELRVYRRSIPDNVRLALRLSTVGEDQNGNDILENLSADAFPFYRDLTPTPTPEPTPEPTEEPTPEPTEEPTQNPTAAPTSAPTPEPTETEKGPAKKPALWWLPAAIGVACAIALWFVLPKHSKARFLLCLMLFAAGILLAFFMLEDHSTEQAKSAVVSVELAAETEMPTSEPTQIPTPEPTAEPTPEPTAEPTEEPTPEPTPDPDDAYYLDGDGEEYELDFENGHWWYKNNALSIDIREVHTTMEQDHALIYYVADIRMREYSSYRSGVRPYVQPWVYARYEKAVLAITGDNLEEERDLKGCMIRKGILYGNAKAADTLVIEDGMKLSVIPRGESSDRMLLDHGIRDTYGFGPILVENGEVSDYAVISRVDHPNPRCGVGMIEPGHWIVIATEGRQTDFSYSITLAYFAQMFVDYGCTVAYNMDGGSSVGVVFMGEALNRHYKRGTTDTQRPWRDAMMFGYSENVPSPDIWTEHDGFRHDF